MVALTSDTQYLAGLIEWDSFGLVKVTGSVTKIEKPFDHFHIYFDQGKPYPIHEKSVQEYQEHNPQPQPTTNKVISIPSSTSNLVYFVDPELQTCTCQGFKYRGYCKHLRQVNLEALVKLAGDYGYEASVMETQILIYEYKYAKMQSVLNINFDQNTKTYWYKPNQNFGNPVNAFKAWLKANYKSPKLSQRIKLAS